MAEVRKERALRGMMFSATFVAGSLVGLILFFLLYFSLPILTSGMLRDFLTKGWDPDARLLGVYPMIVGTVYIAGLATLWATPVGISLAVFMEFVAPNGIKKLIRAFVEFMAGIPTVVYGFAALFLLVPAVRGIFKYGSGLCVLSASLMLALLILPTITLIVQDRLTTVPKSYVLAAKSL
ncbi:MAG: phosphate ABC transporter permease, partial [Deltaproteobacteria bacterium]